MDLFSFQAQSRAPLADRMRPQKLDDFVGQEHLIGRGKLLRRAIEADRLTSSIFFGPPGTGKTTLATIIAHTTNAAFEKLNAVTSGVADVREVIKRAEDRLKMYGQPTYLLLDECHRWNKAQSDSILPALEKGTIRFIGSTTENPMIAMTPAIVSRCRLFRFEALGKQDVKKAVLRAIAAPGIGFGDLDILMEEDALEHIASVANGDVRSALNALELAALTTDPDSTGRIHITLEVAEESIQKRVVRCDESYFYDMLSAFCKSLRGSDSDAALAWASRLLYAGVDPRIIIRRVIAHASEDVGLADPQAMVQAVTAAQSLELLGMPEAGLSITQAIIYVCEAPKSNSVAIAKDKAAHDAQNAEYQSVPVHLQDTSYQGAERLGSGKGYQYPHNFPGHWLPQEYLPRDAKEAPFYEPGELGFEAEIARRRAARQAIRETEK
ncbi:MAG: replication-associated recombination protein A [Eubacteriales bacterium]|nr:replication-associated recombination protein A [Eubacteriales bacterium]